MSAKLPSPSEKLIEDLTKRRDKDPAKSFSEFNEILGEITKRKDNQVFDGNEKLKQFLSSLGYKLSDKFNEKQIQIININYKNTPSMKHLDRIDTIVRISNNGFLLKTKEPEKFIHFPEFFANRFSLNNLSAIAPEQIKILNAFVNNLISLESLSEEKEKLEEQLTKSDPMLDAMQQELKEKNDKILNQEQDLRANIARQTQLQQQFTEAQSKNLKAESLIKSKDEEIKQLEEREKILIKNHQKEVELLKLNFTGTQEKLQQEISNKEAAFKQAQERYTADLRAKQTELDIAKKALEFEQRKAKQLTSQVKNLETSEKSLRSKLDQAHQERDAAKQEIEKLKKELEQLKKDLDNKKSKIEEATQEITQLKQKNIELQGENVSLKQEIAAAKQREAELRRQLEQQTDQLQEANAGLQQMRQNPSSSPLSSAANPTLKETGGGSLFFIKRRVTTQIIKRHSHVTLSIENPQPLTRERFRKITQTLTNQIRDIQKDITENPTQAQEEPGILDQESFKDLSVDFPQLKNSISSNSLTFSDSATILRKKQDILNVSYHDKTIEIVSSKPIPHDDEMYAMVLAAKIAADECGQKHFMIENCESSPETAFKLYLIGKSVGLTPVFKDAAGKQRVTEKGILEGPYGKTALMVDDKRQTVSEIYTMLESKTEWSPGRLKDYIAKLKLVTSEPPRLSK